MLRSMLYEVGISNDFRGWSFAKPPVKPMRDTLLSVSELASRYCPTMRDIFLKKVLKMQAPQSFKMFRGVAYHLVISAVVIESKRVLYSLRPVSGSKFYECLVERIPSLVDRVMGEALKRFSKVSDDEFKIVHQGVKKIAEFLLIEVAHSINQSLSRFPHIDIDSLVSEAIPPITEMKVDGSLVGLSRELSVDIFSPANAVIDVKTGEVRSFHRLTAAGYAIAIEADKGIPVDMGITVYLSVDNSEVPRFTHDVFIVGDELRREFLELRDEAQLLVERGSDPGLPSACPSYCPYYSFCNVKG
ncbi:MAG: type I-A CRISPR-associated protein Cas4/Csa1 [Nitrososphaerota archaeon]|nr:type I-A CRISPR-associated protein Cas4/Csa1 [Nitrososphaerota archaeon]